MSRPSVLSELREVRRMLTMETMSVGEIFDVNGPPKFADGRAVTEKNVSDFIRERTRLWRESWVLGPLDDVIARLERRGGKAGAL